MLSKFTKQAFTAKFSKASSLKFYHTTKPLKQELFTEQFLNGSNSVYLEQMYDNWSQDKASVHPSWDAYFINFSKGITGTQAFQLPPTLQSSAPGLQQGAGVGLGASAGVDVKQKIRDSFRIFLLLKSYMRRGHEIADVDPLSMTT